MTQGDGLGPLARHVLDLVLDGADPGRAARGDRYHEQERVQSLTVEPGQLTAQVEGSRSRPYRVSMWCDVLEPGDQQQVLRHLETEARSLPHLSVEEAVTAALPRQVVEGEATSGGEPKTAPGDNVLIPLSDIMVHCTCPDWETHCKHVVAVARAVAQRLDHEPTFLLAWLGLDAERVRQQVVAGQRAGGRVSPPVRDDEVESFWGSGPAAASPQPAAAGQDEGEHPVIPRLLGPPPAPDGDGILQALEDAYRLMAVKAHELLALQDAEEG